MGVIRITKAVSLLYSDGQITLGFIRSIDIGLQGVQKVEMGHVTRTPPFDCQILNFAEISICTVLNKFCAQSTELYG